MLTLYINGKEIMKMGNTLAMRQFHTPARRGSKKWVIVDETGRAVDSYTPPKVVKPKPITPYKGSWAESMATR